jgi:hypothetical protein
MVFEYARHDKFLIFKLSLTFIVFILGYSKSITQHLFKARRYFCHISIRILQATKIIVSVALE